MLLGIKTAFWSSTVEHKMAESPALSALVCTQLVHLVLCFDWLTKHKEGLEEGLEYDTICVFKAKDMDE